MQLIICLDSTIREYMFHMWTSCNQREASSRTSNQDPPLFSVSTFAIYPASPFCSVLSVLFCSVLFCVFPSFFPFPSTEEASCTQTHYLCGFDCVVIFSCADPFINGQVSERKHDSFCFDLFLSCSEHIPYHRLDVTWTEKSTDIWLFDIFSISLTTKFFIGTKDLSEKRTTWMDTSSLPISTDVIAVSFLFTTLPERYFPACPMSKSRSWFGAFLFFPYFIVTARWSFNSPLEPIEFPFHVIEIWDREIEMKRCLESFSPHLNLSISHWKGSPWSPIIEQWE